MSSNSVHEFPLDSPAVAPVAMVETRPMYWSIRREIWENRSIYIAPLLVAAFVMLGALFNTLRLPQRITKLSALNEAQQRAAISTPFSAVVGSLIFTTFLVGVFYCLEALHTERRDRSILFWKSLPVSDRTTVLSKATIPLLVLPAIVVAIALTGHVVMIALTALILAPNPRGFALVFSHIKFFQMTFAMFYGLIAIVLWHAPIYCWFLLISGWARRAAILWAVLPLLVLAGMERAFVGTKLLFMILQNRMIGGVKLAFVFPPKGTTVAVDPLAHLTPERFLSAPGLWFGLLFAAACLAGAIRLRRQREAM
jgi:ABC-2 type transport system permease protein